MSEPSIIRSIRVPADLYTRLEAEDRRQGGRRQNGIITEALERWLSELNDRRVKRQRLDKVAGIIRDLYVDVPDELQPDDLESEVSERNDRDGWNYDVRWTDGDYPTDDDYTRVEGDRLTDNELAEAIAAAQRMVAS